MKDIQPLINGETRHSIAEDMKDAMRFEFVLKYARDKKDDGDNELLRGVLDRAIDVVQVLLRHLEEITRIGVIRYDIAYDIGEICDLLEKKEFDRWYCYTYGTDVNEDESTQETEDEK